jgi:hypothetical protein
MPDILQRGSWRTAKPEQLERPLCLAAQWTPNGNPWSAGILGTGGADLGPSFALREEQALVAFCRVQVNQIIIAPMTPRRVGGTPVEAFISFDRPPGVVGNRSLSGICDRHPHNRNPPHPCAHRSGSIITSPSRASRSSSAFVHPCAIRHVCEQPECSEVLRACWHQSLGDHLGGGRHPHV